ncbi:MAG TPA: GvpL/GvpF family gas vesicle protein [Coleofasciculaceae cyanobacterium]
MYIYAFLPNPTRALELPPGISGSVQLIPGKDLAALVEPDLDFAALQASDEQLLQAILAHDRVTRELFQQTTLLPLKFGTRFVSQQGLLEHLAVHQSEYTAKLAQLQGKAEYLLKLIGIPYSEPTIAPDLKGKDYFFAKKQSYQAQMEWQQQQQAELQQLEDELAKHYSDWVRGEPGNGIERFYILGDRIQERLLYEHLAVWQSQLTHWELSVGEMLPPYHFV